MFPQEEGKEVDTWIVMVVDAICKGIGKEEEAQKHYSLASIILADIYRSLCKNEFHFFNGAIFCFSGGWLNICVKIDGVVQNEQEETYGKF